MGFVPNITSQFTTLDKYVEGKTYFILYTEINEDCASGRRYALSQCALVDTCFPKITTGRDCGNVCQLICEVLCTNNGRFSERNADNP